MTVQSVIQMVLAAGVAGAYFTIAAVVVPRLQLEDASSLFSRFFHLGAVAFFIGCGLTHLHITIHAATTPQEVELHELFFHLAQIGGGWLFIIAAVRFLDIKLVRRRSPEEVAAEALAAKNVELTRSNVELAQFAHVISHDLRQPLRTINGFNSLLLRKHGDQLDEEAHHFLDEVTASSKHMSELLEGILTFSKVGGDKLEFGLVDLDEVLDSVLGSLTELINNAGAEITVAPLPTVWGDRTQIIQTFQNLISNAIKFRASEATPQVQIRATGRDAGGLLELEVADNGIGIEEKYREQIFGMFKRLHSQADYPGTGVGLSIVAKVIERHGGEIEVGDGPGGVGSSFRFTLPRPLAGSALRGANTSDERMANEPGAVPA